MSKLSPALKALINSPAARPSIVPAPAHITSVYQAIQQTAIAKRLSDHSWLTLSADLPDSVSSKLSTTPTRAPVPNNITSITCRGISLWDSIYHPYERKLYNKLADSHPDLPVHILNSHYGALLSDPVRSTGAQIGRILTSIVAVSCLRAQSGVGPQVTSHVFGLRKALEDGTWSTDVETEEGARWLASDEGNTWILNSVDSIVEAIGNGHGSNFAPGSQ
ncbi:hypothetical protein N7533_011911 [Penicillium manginii]|uniref:uncharacterized protein n=1 Tax=Penicillium manginii TaxID=203109 RepID=UPI0025498661|nr:uncharacterized protein N7533_011911 [Penicillium manginii]KAJ5739127.1 hypothetical protein N7533_011911 [Penicillium manginii]